MKTISAIFVILVFLCGCSAKKEVKITSSPMSFDCIIERADEKYAVSVKTSKNADTVTAKIDSPENLNSLKYTLENGVLFTEFMDINITRDIEDAPEDNAVISLLRTVKDFCGKPTVENKDGNYEYSGKTDVSEYRVAVSPSGLPLGIKTVSSGITVEIKNLTLVK